MADWLDNKMAHARVATIVASTIDDEAGAMADLMAGLLARRMAVSSAVTRVAWKEDQSADSLVDGMDNWTAVLTIDVRVGTMVDLMAVLLV
jgi:hypothetical protein